MNKMDSFIGLSAVLTGFSKEKLAPELDPVDIKSQYLAIWCDKTDTQTPTLSDKILATYAALAAETPPLSDQQIGEKMLADANGDAFVLACRQLIYLWYMGAWPSFVDNDSETGQGTVYSTVSAEAYSAGLVWQVMQAHPMGDSNERYGYWAETPVALSKYTGQQQTNGWGDSQ